MLLQKELGVIEHSLYEATVKRDFPHPPLAADINADVCVIGGGYAGLSAALELAERGYNVVLLEAQRLGWGASGRNGGQVIAGFGADGEHALQKQFAPDDMRKIWDISLAGIKLLSERIERYKIDCDYSNGYLHVATNNRRAKSLLDWNDHVERAFDYPMQPITNTEIESWIASKRYRAAIFDPHSGHLHPLKYCLGLGDAATKAGVRIFEHSAAFSFERGPQPLIKTAQGQVSCRFAVIACNVYLNEYSETLAPEVFRRILPIGTYIIATEPMTKARADDLIRHRAAVADNNFILDYFRLSKDNRLLFGGGDNFREGEPRHILKKLQKQMLRVFPQLNDLTVTHAWGGFVDMTMNRAPDFGRIGTNVYYLQGFSGHGIAVAGIAGKLVAEAISGQCERFDLLARIKHRDFPSSPHLRTALLQLGAWYYQIMDRL